MKMNSKQRIAFIVQSIILLCGIGFLLWCLIGIVSIGKYPSANSLVYEECTFVRCEQKNTAKSSRYYIYVEEYEKPLEIDNIVLGQIDREALLALELGDKITVSKYDGKKSTPCIHCHTVKRMYCRIKTICQGIIATIRQESWFVPFRYV